MLYALRFENNANNSLNLVLDLLRQRGIANKHIQLIRILLDYAGQKRRQNDVFGNRSAMEMTKRFIKGYHATDLKSIHYTASRTGLKGVENIFTQHEPYVAQLIDLASRGKLSESQFPSTDLSGIK
jgi:vacuolar protein sorting-associated protein 45